MIRKIDARGKKCPLPVIETKKMLLQSHPGDEVETLVDNEVAVENLKKLASSFPYNSESREIAEQQFVVTIQVSVLPNKEESPQPDFLDATQKGTVVTISSDKMGEGDMELGKLLIKGFLYALTEQEQLPEVILFYNAGAKLTVTGSDSLEDLQLLESQGVEIITCGTCLNHYELTDKLAVGTVTNMYSIAEKLMQAKKIIKL